MQKLDRLGWAAGFTFIVNGLRIGVRTNSPEIIRELTHRLPLGWKLAHNGFVDALFSFKVGDNRRNIHQFHLVFGNSAPLARTKNLDIALDVFERNLQLYVTEYARHRVFVHAGVIGWRGKALIIPGRSFCGKSTLVLEMAKAGATYYSDEYAAIDSRGRVHPYPVPIGMRTTSDVIAERILVETFGGNVGTKPIPIGLVVITNYKAGSRWRPKQILAGAGMLAILPNTFSAQTNPAKALATLQQVLLKAPVLKSLRGEAGEVVDALLNHPWPTLP